MSEVLRPYRLIVSVAIYSTLKSNLTGMTGIGLSCQSVNCFGGAVGTYATILLEVMYLYDLEIFVAKRFSMYNMYIFTKNIYVFFSVV